MIKFGKPLFRIWFTLEYWLAKVPHHSIKRFDTAMFIAMSLMFLIFLQFQKSLTIDVDRISGIIVILLIVFLIKKWWFTDSVEQQASEQQNTFEIFPDDSLALEHFVSLLFAFMALIFFLLLTGELWISLIVAGLFAIRIDFVGSGADEAEWKILLDNKSVLFDNDKKTARLLLAEVSQMKVYLAFNQPKKIIFEMNDGQLHQIKHYRRMDEILNYCTHAVPESKTSWVSYT